MAKTKSATPKAPKAAASSGVQTIIHNNFVGGVDMYLGSRQVADNESPNATDCDFKGSGGVGSRLGFVQLGSAGSYSSGVYGMNEYHTSSLNQIVKFASNGTNVVALYSNNGGSTWSAATGNTFTDATNVNTVQAVSTTTVPYTGVDGTLFTFNGVDTMQTFNGTAVASYTGGATLLYGCYFDDRLWGVNPTFRDTLYFSTKTPDATEPLNFSSNGTSSNFGTVSFTPGAGTEIMGMHVFQGAMYVFTRKEIYSMVPASAANTYTVTLVTAAIGCVSHRSIATVENDLYFASRDGVYTLGNVATYPTVRNANISLRVQRVFDSFNGTQLSQLVGRYFNYKYRLYYSLFGGLNDSCLIYDIRYQGWQDWRNMAANDATTFTDSNKNITFYFGHPTTGAVYQSDIGTTNDGAAITSIWYSKSYDNGLPDVLKLFFYSDFVFSLLNGSVSISIIFNDTITSVTTSLTQQSPQGGFGNYAFGRDVFGGGNNTITITPVVSLPQRLKAKGQYFAIQYMIQTTGSWRLDAIGQAFMPMTPWKFPASQKLN